MRPACDEIGRRGGPLRRARRGAAWAAAKLLRDAGGLDPASRVVLFNTGTGFKYL